MKLAWFRATALEQASTLDPTAAILAELGRAHHLDVFRLDNAHDFVWKAFRAPYDVSVFELDNDLSHAFVWPYLLHYSGVLFLRTLTLHDARATALARGGRRDDYITEFTFNEGCAPLPTRAPPFVRHGSWPMLRVPLMASRVAVVPHKGMAAVIQERHPDARVAYAPLGVREPSMPAPQTTTHATFGVLSSDRVDVAQRAAARARDNGADATLLVDPSPELLIRNADVLIALAWPSYGEPQMFALTAMAAGKPVIVLETEYTADWPALDPQTWQPRGLQKDAPIAVSIDVRDEEHSLAVAMRRLSLDGVLRRTLGSAATRWCHSHATVGQAVDAWERILGEAAALDTPPRPAGWPAHLLADGSEHARATLADFGVAVDFLVAE